MVRSNYAIDHHVNDEFVNKIFNKHSYLKGALRAEWLRVSARESYVQANDRLRRLDGRLTLGKTGLYMDSRDSEIVDYCKAKARKMERDITDFALRKMKDAVFDYAVTEVQKAGLDFPLDDLENFEIDDMLSAVKRVCDAKWWRYQIRKLQKREVEAVARDIRLVHTGAGIYSSDYAVRNHLEQKKRNRALLEDIEAVNESDENKYCATLAELSDKSVSNPVNRRGELMVRIRGFEELAIQAGHIGLFLTLTCPSKYHAVLKAGAINKKYKGATPRDAQAYLCDVWSRIRAEWARNEIQPYGFRVAEPHHDGTPHWHAMLFIEPDKKALALSIFKKHAHREDKNERGADKYRTKIVEIDPAKGSASGYIAKYISKNIDGFGVDADLYGRDAKSSALRICTWAATWGIRQFQQIGGASVTVWRELRRLTEEDLKESDKDLQDVRKAADAADWAAFTMLMGGVQVKRNEQLLRPLYKDKEEENEYGEFGQVLKGLFHVGGEFITRIHDWVMQKAGTQEKRENLKNRFTLEDSLTHKRMNAQAALGRPIECVGSFFREAGTASTWTCVNNCTGAKPPDRDWHESEILLI